MGALHEGHLSLVKKASTVSKRIVVSIFINPTQFGPKEDFNSYPRVLDKDLELLSPYNVDAVFAPDPKELYSKFFQTWITNKEKGNILCGIKRKNHFDGVLTIVLKLLNIIKPNYAFFGKKDSQQLLLIQKMIEDLNLETKIISCPTIRNQNGLALSSRNNYLSKKDQNTASEIYKALQLVKQKILAKEMNMEAIKSLFQKSLKEKGPFEIEYLEILDPINLNPIEGKSGESFIAFTACMFNGVRLIDNIDGII